MALILCLDSEDPAADQNMKLVEGESGDLKTNQSIRKFNEWRLKGVRAQIENPDMDLFDTGS